MNAGKAVLAAVLALAMFAAGARAQQNAVPAVAIDDDDIGGVVTSRFGPEAGVWVIAQTTELGTRFAKIAVTDERGRYIVPDLPKAHYQVWVRGYGLVDSPKVAAEPGKILNLTAGNCTEPRRGGAVLSGDLLGLDDQDPGTRAASPAPAIKATAFPKISRPRTSG